MSRLHDCPCCTCTPRPPLPRAVHVMACNVRIGWMIETKHGKETVSGVSYCDGMVTLSTRDFRHIFALPAQQRLKVWKIDLE